MTQSKFISSEPKSGYSPEAMATLGDKIKATIEKIDKLNGDALANKLDLAKRNRFITEEQEKRLTDALLDDDGVYDRYNSGEATEDLLAALEAHYEKSCAAKQELFDAMPELKGIGDEPVLDNKELVVDSGQKKERRSIKNELVDRLDAALKELFVDYVNEKKDAPKELYDSIEQIENELRSMVKHRGEVGDLVEKLKGKYKEDERSEEEKAKKGKKAAQEGEAEKRMDKKPGYTKAMLEARAAEIKQRRFDNEPGFDWVKIDQLLRDKGFEPGTPEADKFMQEWDEKAARQELIKEGEEKKATKEIIRPVPEPRKNKKMKEDFSETVPKDSGGTKKEEPVKLTADVAAAEELKPVKKQPVGGEVDWDKSAIIAAERSNYQPEEVDWGKSLVLVAESGGVKGETEEGLKIKSEKPGATEKSPIELTEAIEKPEKESNKAEIETALDKTRESYVAALAAKEKADKTENKLTSLRAMLGRLVDHFDETKTAKRGEKVDAAHAEAQEAKNKLAQAEKEHKEALKNYRQVVLMGEEEKLKKLGKTAEEMKVELEKISQQIATFTTLGEFAKIEDLKMNKQIEQMGKTRQFINEKAEEFTEWYKELPLKGKLAVSAGLTVAGVAGGLVGSTAILTSALIGQAALRVLGGTMTTAGVERLLRNIEERKEGKDLNKEFSGKFLETLKNQNDQLDERLFKMVKNQQTRKNMRFAVAGVAGAVVGSGALAQMFKSIFSTPVEGVKGAKGPAVSGVEKVAGATPSNIEHAMTGHVSGQSIISLEIGRRGPEGAIIDYLKNSSEIAKQYGWEGKTDIKKWAGAKAHQLWLKSVEGELARPGIAAKLTAQGFTADAEGYAKAMHKIGKGFVELDPTGRLQLSDNTSFLKAGAISEAVSNVSPEIPVEPETSLPAEAPAPTPQAPKPEVPLLSPEELEHEKIKETVARLVEPAILTDKTFKAAAKVTLGKILENVPAEVYEDKWALSRYWHSLSGLGVKTPDLPGSSWLGLTYDDFRKYADMAKLLRENPVLKSAAGLQNMTVEEFLKIYGKDLTKEQ